MSMAHIAVSSRLRPPAAFNGYLWWDFTKRHSVPPGFTYTRNSVKYVWNPTLNQYVPLAANVYAPDYDPLTNACRGYLSESSQTNQITYSSAYVSSVGAQAVYGCTYAAGGNPIINGAGCCLFTLTGTVGGEAQQTFGTFGGGKETYYAIVEQGTCTQATIAIFNITAAANSCSATLTFSTGVVTVGGTSGSGRTGGAILLLNAGPNGGKVYLLWAQVTETAGNTRAARVGSYATNQQNSTLYYHHRQYTSDSIIGSPIVTTSATVARAADVMQTSSLPAWYDNSKVTMLAKFERTQDVYTQIGFPCVPLNVSDGTANNIAQIRHKSASANTALTVTAGGVNQCAIDRSFTTGVGTYAGSATANLFDGSLGGSAGTQDTNGTLFTASKIEIGCDQATGYWANGWIQQIGIAPITQTSAQLNALTA